jgi:hypothetical protein
MGETLGFALRLTKQIKSKDQTQEIKGDKRK